MTKRAAARVFQFEMGIGTHGIVTVFTDGSVLVATPKGPFGGTSVELTAEMVSEQDPTIPWRLGGHVIPALTVARVCLWSARFVNAAAGVAA